MWRETEESGARNQKKKTKRTTRRRRRRRYADEKPGKVKTPTVPFFSVSSFDFCVEGERLLVPSLNPERPMHALWSDLI
jgi:hypothetical protein